MTTPSDLLGKPLSRREQQILERLSNGCNTQKIADDLYVSVSTVRTFKEILFAKLGAVNAPHAVTIGFRRGLLGNGIVEDLEVVRLARKAGYRLAVVPWDAA